MQSANRYRVTALCGLRNHRVSHGMCLATRAIHQLRATTGLTGFAALRPSHDDRHSVPAFAPRTGRVLDEQDWQCWTQLLDSWDRESRASRERLGGSCMRSLVANWNRASGEMRKQNLSKSRGGRRDATRGHGGAGREGEAEYATKSGRARSECRTGAFVDV